MGSRRTGAAYGLGRRVAMALWDRWERLYVRLGRLYEVPGDAGRVFRLGFRRWNGPPVVLSDGTVVQPGDWVAEIHLNSPRFARVWQESGGHAGSAVLRLAAEMRRAMQLLAREVQAGRLPVPAVALFGKTLLDRGLGRLGFELHPLPDTPGHRLLACYERWLLRLYHPEGARYASRRERLQCAWLSRAQLLHRHLDGPPDAPRAGGTGMRGATRNPPKPATAGPT